MRSHGVPFSVVTGTHQIPFDMPIFFFVGCLMDCINYRDLCIDGKLFYASQCQISFSSIEMVE